MIKNKNVTLLAILSIVLGASLWGCIGIFVRQLSDCGLTNLQITGYRTIITAILLSPLLLTSKNDYKFKLNDSWFFIGTGIISIVFFNFCYFSTINLTSLSVASILLYTSPIFVTIIAYFVFKEKITIIKTISLALCILGSVLVSGVLSTNQTLSVGGILLGLGSGLGYGLYSIFARFALKKYNSFMVACYTFIFGGVFCLFIVDLPKTLPLILASPTAIITIVSLGFFCGAVPYILYNFGLSKIGASKSSVIATIEPVVATFIGIILFSESLSLMAIIGAILVVVAVIICR